AIRVVVTRGIGSRTYHRKWRAALKNGDVGEFPITKNFVQNSAGMRTGHLPQSGKGESVPDIKVGESSFAAVVICLRVFRGIVFARLINRLTKCVRSIQCKAMLSPLLYRGRQTIVVAVFIR